MGQAEPDKALCDPREMIELARRGDPGALDTMTRCYGDRLLAAGRRYCRDAEMARDATQDAWEAAGRHLDSFRGEGSLEGWLVRLVANACHHMRRGRKNDPYLHSTDAELASREDDPEEMAARGQAAETLGALLLTLSPEDRTILLLAEADDWQAPQIAEALELTPAAVRKRLSRIRARLRERLSSGPPQGAGS